tara:strand:+ start:158 stop:349 length:192 start_codon:yes stop_codon:yes gene_type:complete
MKRPGPRKDYTQTTFYKVCFACLAASAIYMTWTSLPSPEAWVFIASFSAMLGLTYKNIINYDE